MEPMMNLSEEKIVNISLCILCQKRKKQNNIFVKLVLTKGDGITRLQNAARKREEYGEINSTIRRIKSCLVNDSHINLSLVKYHSNCYKAFVSQEKIDRLLPVIKETVINENSHIERPYKVITRSKINTFNWKLCIFCQTKTKETPHKLTLMENFSTFLQK